MSDIWAVLMQLDLMQSIHDFMEKGGAVLWSLALVMCLCWALVIERLFTVHIRYRHFKSHCLEQWQQRQDQVSWYAQAYKVGMLQQAHRLLNRHLNLLKGLVTLCPMLGLLGTVTGMIQVFDVMALNGTSDAKLMASGISMATLPTMAGMVAALTGMFAHARLSKMITRKELHLEQQLRSGGCV